MCERVLFGKTATQMDFLDGCPMEMGPTAAENRCLARSFGSQALVLPHSLWAIESRNVLIRIPQNGSAAGNWYEFQYSILDLFRGKRTCFMPSLSEIIVSRLRFYDKLHWDQDRHANACVDIVLANSPLLVRPRPSEGYLLTCCWFNILQAASCSYRTRMLCNKAWLR